jgi:hypothetical protein
MPSQRSAQEFFDLDDDHQRQDADLHEPILADGDHAAALAVGKAVMMRLGLSAERIAALTSGKKGK